MSPRRVLLAFSLLVTACAPSEDAGAVDLHVLVRTDLVAGREFAWVEVALPERGRTVRLPAVVGSFQRVTEAAFFDRLPRSAHRMVRVTLLDTQGSVVLTRPMVFPHERRLAVVARMSRACRDHDCPAACHGGRCVDPECVEGTEETCRDPAPECVADSECPASAPCSVGRCDVDGCWLDVRAGACGAGETCDVERGCVPLPEPPREDAAVVVHDDAGVAEDATAIDADTDGGAADGGAAEGEVDGGLADGDAEPSDPSLDAGSVGEPADDAGSTDAGEVDGGEPDDGDPSG